MNIIETLIRIFLFVILFYYMVILWSLAPILNTEMEILLTLEGYFFGDTPTGLSRKIMLSSRGLLGLGFSFYVLIPAFRYFFEFEPRPWANTALLVFALSGVGAFFLSILVYLYY